MSSRCALALGLALAAAAALAGCGKKGDPLPPLRPVPAATGDLSVQQRGSEVILRFAYPRTTAAGLVLPAVERVEVWEMVRALVPPAATSDVAAAGDAGDVSEEVAEITDEAATPDETETSEAATAGTGAPAPPAPATQPPAVDPREFQAAAVLRQSLDGDELAAAVRGDRIEVRLPLAEPVAGGDAVYVAVRTAAGGYVSAYSNLASLVPREPPPPPTGLGAEAGVEGVELTWQVSGEGGEDGEDGDGHHVYRRDAQTREFGPPIGRAPAGDVSYLDRSAVYGRRYIYAVTRVASRQPLIESAIGETREVDYRDRFPPPVPGAVVALADEGRIRLVWNESRAPDLAGYRVFRRTADGEWRLLGDELTVRPERVDTDVVPGATYAYRVTAVDELGNESEPSPTGTAVAR